MAKLPASPDPELFRASGEFGAPQPTRPIDPKLAFEAAVSLARSSGSIRRASQASQDLSRLTDSSYVLMGPGGVTLKRFPRSELLTELERLERLNGNLEQHRLRFGPGRGPVLITLFALAGGVVAVQALVNEINERRLSALEQSYLAHQQSLAQGSGAAAQEGLETISDFQARLQRVRFDGCYQEARDTLARATQQLSSAQASGSRDESSLRLVDARGAYEQFRASRATCRQAMWRFLPRLYPS